MNSHQRRVAFRKNCKKHKLLPHQINIMNKMRKNKTSLQECIVHRGAGKTETIRKRLPVGFDGILGAKNIRPDAISQFGGRLGFELFEHQEEGLKSLKDMPLGYPYAGGLRSIVNLDTEAGFDPEHLPLIVKPNAEMLEMMKGSGFEYDQELMHIKRTQPDAPKETLQNSKAITEITDTVWFKRDNDEN